METFVTTKVILCNDADILVLKRNDDDPHRPGEFDLPGGGLLPGESPEAAAVRETHEETGQRLALDGLRWAYSSTSAYPERSATVIRLFFTAATLSREVELTEHSQDLWVARTKLIAQAGDVPKMNPSHLVAIGHVDRHNIWPQAV